MKASNGFYLLLKNAILFVVGFIIYILIEYAFRGFSYPLMGIIGGLALVIIDKLNDHISWNLDLVIQGLIGMFVILIMEFIIGEIALRTDLLPIMWDYSNMPFNIDGVVCPQFSMAWFVLSIVAIFVADYINYYLLHEEPRPYYKIMGRIVLQFKGR